MPITTPTREITSPIPASKMLQGLRNVQNLLPKILPDSIEITEGEEEQFVAPQNKIFNGRNLPFISSIMESADSEGRFYLLYDYNKGAVLERIDKSGRRFYKVNKTELEVKVEALGNGERSVWNLTSHHHAKDGVEIDEEELNAYDEKGVEILKALEEYIIAHPDLDKLNLV